MPGDKWWNFSVGDYASPFLPICCQKISYIRRRVSLNHAIHTSINLLIQSCGAILKRPQLDKDQTAGMTLLKSKDNPRENLSLLCPHLVFSHSGARRVSRNRRRSFRRWRSLLQWWGQWFRWLRWGLVSIYSARPSFNFYSTICNLHFAPWFDETGKKGTLYLQITASWTGDFDYFSTKPCPPSMGHNWSPSPQRLVA